MRGVHGVCVCVCVRVWSATQDPSRVGAGLPDQIPAPGLDSRPDGDSGVVAPDVVGAHERDLEDERERRAQHEPGRRRHAPQVTCACAEKNALVRCSDITNTQVGISGETVPEGGNLCIY